MSDILISALKYFIFSLVLDILCDGIELAI